MNLAPKQARFVEEYLLDLNAAAAYRRAGYRARGNSAETCAARLLRNVQVATAVAVAQAARSQRAQVNADGVVEELARVAFSNIRDLPAWGPAGMTLRPSADTSAGAVAAVQSIAVTPAGVTIRMHDKLSALRLLGEHLGLFRPRPPLAILLDALPTELAAHVRRVLIDGD